MFHSLGTVFPIGGSAKFLFGARPRGELKG
jgi:hypothetical protein